MSFTLDLCVSDDPDDSLSGFGAQNVNVWPYSAILTGSCLSSKLAVEKNVL
jgi:hypothetical protein